MANDKEPSMVPGPRAAKGRGSIIFPPQTTHTATIIFLHGISDTAAGWVELPRNWRRRGLFPYAKFILLTAEARLITAYQTNSNTWYDIPTKGTNWRDRDWHANDSIVRDIKDSISFVSETIQSEIADGIPSHRIMIGGYSQGGQIALLTGVFHQQKLAGIFSLCGFNFYKNMTTTSDGNAYPNRRTRMIMLHGENDPTVPNEAFRSIVEDFRGDGFEVETRTFPGVKHVPDPMMLDALDEWIKEVFEGTRHEGKWAKV